MYDNTAYENNFSLPQSLRPLQVSELTSRAARLTKDKNSALSKMSLWMKTCKQLEQEKEMMLNSSGVHPFNRFTFVFSVMCSAFYCQIKLSLH